MAARTAVPLNIPTPHPCARRGPRCSASWHPARPRPESLTRYSAARAGASVGRRPAVEVICQGSGSMSSLPPRSRRRWSRVSGRIGGRPNEPSCRSAASGDRRSRSDRCCLDQFTRLSRPVHPARTCAQDSCSDPTPATSRTGGTSGWAAAPTEHGMRGACDRTTATDAWTPILAFARARWELADFADATLRDGSCRVRVTATVAGWAIRSATGQGVAMTDATAARARPPCRAVS
jgi:hypothetical protein